MAPPTAQVNLLVAMFSETYSRIKTRAELEYLFQKSFRIHHHMNVTHRYAPVLNAPFVICEVSGAVIPLSLPSAVSTSLYMLVPSIPPLPIQPSPSTFLPPASPIQSCSLRPDVSSPSASN